MKLSISPPVNHKHLKKFNPGIGATEELSLRVSVATLVRVLFEHPQDGDLMLALESKATLLEAEHGQDVDVKAQPFGGAIQLRGPSVLRNVIGDFHFDSERSHSEQDFRIFIRPSSWESVRQFCLQHFNDSDDPVLESDPTRELVEEFGETLKINLGPDQYILKSRGTIIENDPSPTDNFYARGHPTVRIYHIFEARLLDASLARMMLTNTTSYSDEVLCQRALEDARNDGPGWANAMLTLPLERIRSFYSSIAPETRNTPVFFQNHQLDETVAAILEGVTVPKYQRLVS
jgi:hypothetical protein